MHDQAQAAFCFGCFADKPGAGPCPLCGFDEAAPRAANALPLGTVLCEQFIVGRVLGKPGGFGITYLGFDRRLRTTVAIKEYLPRDLATRGGDGSTVLPHTQDEQNLFEYGLQQFLTEAQTLAQLDHPNIVRVRQFFAANRSAYLVMDYYRGVSLTEHLDAQPPGTDGRRHLSEATALGLILPILDGLRAVHAKSFLHRDIKPQNIYLAQTEGGGVRPILLDFGTARLAMGERSRSMSVVISPGFAPFEQYHRSGKQGPWTDLYGAAAVLYWMLTGLTPPEATERVHADSLAPAAALGVSADVSAAVARALAMDPAARPQTAAAFQAELCGARPAPAGPVSPPALPVTGPAGMPPPEYFERFAPQPAQRAAEPPAADQTDSPAPTGRATLARRIAAALIAVALLAGGGFAVWQGYRETQANTDAAAFTAAERDDTEAAYGAYLDGCAATGCGHRAGAEAKLAALREVAARRARDDAAFALARATDTAGAYRAYLDHCAGAGCGHRDEAEAQLGRLARAESARDDEAFAEARAADSAAAYRRYLRACAPDGCQHRDEAERRLAELDSAANRRRRDAVAYAEARNENSIEAYRRYLNTCADNGCGRRSDAQRWLADLETIAARTRRDADAYAEARTENSIEAYRRYLNTCADTGCGKAAEAKQRLERLVAAEEANRCRSGYLSGAQIRALVSGRTAVGVRVNVSQPSRWREYQDASGIATFKKSGGSRPLNGRWTIDGDNICWCYGSCETWSCKRVWVNQDCSAWYYDDPATGESTARVDAWRQGKQLD
jgi:serine/threonine protein kinase